MHSSLFRAATNYTNLADCESNSEIPETRNHCCNIFSSTALQGPTESCRKEVCRRGNCGQQYVLRANVLRYIRPDSSKAARIQLAHWQLAAAFQSIVSSLKNYFLGAEVEVDSSLRRRCYAVASGCARLYVR